MNEASILIETLKQILKSQGISYKLLAKDLNLSEASVKRIFSENSFSLARFCQVCEIIDISFKELSDLADLSNENKSYTYTNEQELYLSQEPRSLAFFDLLLKYESVQLIHEKYKITKKELNIYLTNLEKQGLIERHINDRIKFCNSKNIKWREDGPLKRKFKAIALNDFAKDNFDSQNGIVKLSSLQLSKKSQMFILKKIEELNTEIVQISAMEDILKLKRESFGILLGCKKWKFSLINLELRQ
jgi:transcriptional regulator with XRE-family HTH domain